MLKDAKCIILLIENEPGKMRNSNIQVKHLEKVITHLSDLREGWLWVPQILEEMVL